LHEVNEELLAADLDHAEVAVELTSGTIRRARSSAPLLPASTLLLILITFPLKPFFDGQEPSKNPRRDLGASNYAGSFFTGKKM
jgi:hypothetical protein